MYNNLGSLIYFENLKCQQKIEMNFSSFTKGFYHVNLQFDKGVENHKILNQYITFYFLTLKKIVYEKRSADFRVVLYYSYFI